MNEPQQLGQLYLIPNRLGEQPPLEVMPLSVKKIIEKVDHYIVENEKVARQFIKKMVSSKSQDKLVINTLNKYTSELEIPTYLNACQEGYDIGLISDAGCPGVADPGAEIVELAHQKGIKVVPLVGPSSILLSLMASGLSGQSFTFHGYLPIDKNEKKRILKKLEAKSRQDNQTQLFIETPYRNNQLIEDILKTLHPQTRLCIAVNLATNDEYIKTKSIEEWKTEHLDFHKQPAIFLFQA
mgnify:CR=1 FL=1